MDDAAAREGSFGEIGRDKDRTIQYLGQLVANRMMIGI